MSNTRSFIVGPENKKGFIFNHLKPPRVDRYFQFVFVWGFFLGRTGSAPPVEAFVTAASAVSGRAVARLAYSSLWLSTTASLMCTPTSAGREWRMSRTFTVAADSCS